MLMGIFEEVNRRFASCCREAAPGATVWVHDYNLCPPGYLRAQRPDLKIASSITHRFRVTTSLPSFPGENKSLKAFSCDVVGSHPPLHREFCPAKALVG